MLLERDSRITTTADTLAKQTVHIADDLHRRIDEIERRFDERIHKVEMKCAAMNGCAKGGE